LETYPDGTYASLDAKQRQSEEQNDQAENSDEEDAMEQAL